MAQEFPDPTFSSKTIENRRSLIRRALYRTPHDPRLQMAIRNSLKPHLIHKAAKRGVFICYTASDGLLALDLFTDLRAAGVRVWMDEIEVSQLDEETEWGEVVGNALRGCGVLLLILSPAAIKDSDVMGERKYFFNAGKIVLPVLAEECDISGLGLYVEPVSFIDDYEAGLQKVLPLLLADSSETAK